MSRKNRPVELIVGKVERPKRRAIELYHQDSPFRQKVVPKAGLYQRHKKHRNSEDE